MQNDNRPKFEFIYREEDPNYQRQAKIRRKKKLDQYNKDAALFYQLKAEEEAAKSGLSVSDPGDAAEQQADTIARQVVNNEEVSPITPISSGDVQPKQDGDVPPITPSFESKLNSTKGGGSSLDENTRTEMEGKMGADFSQTKIHTGNAASELSQEVNAKAFTHGQDIYFNSNQSPANKELLAHELVHAGQQGAGNKLQRKDGEDLLNEKGTHARVGRPVLGIFGKKKTLMGRLEKVLKEPMKSSTGSTKNKPDYKAFTEGLKKIIDNRSNRISGSSPGVSEDMLQQIGQKASNFALGWVGNYQGVNTRNITFEFGKNITGSDKNTLSGKEEIIYHLKLWGEYISPNYPGIILNSAPFDKAIDDVYATTDKKKLKILAQGYAGSTGEYNMMELTRFSMSDTDIMEKEIESYDLSLEAVDLLGQLFNEMLIQAEADLATASAPDKPKYEAQVQQYTQLYFFITVEHRKRVFNKEKADQYKAEGQDFRKDTGTTMGSENLDESSVFPEDSHTGESHALDDLIKRLKDQGLDQPGSGATAGQKTELKNMFASSMTSLGSKMSTVNAYGLTNKDILLRYKIFQTVLHEFFHYIIHLNYLNETELIGESDPYRYAILREGMIDLFALYIWKNFKSRLNNKSDIDVMLIRGAIEGWGGQYGQYGFTPPDADETLLPHYHLYESAYAAFELEKQLGIDALKAAYFLGHTEILGMGSGSAVRKYNRAKKKGKDSAYFMPPATSDLGAFTNTLYQIAFENGMYTVLQGAEEDAAWEYYKTTVGTTNKLALAQYDLRKKEKEWRKAVLEAPAKIGAAQTEESDRQETMDLAKISLDELKEKIRVKEDLLGKTKGEKAREPIQKELDEMKAVKLPALELSFKMAEDAYKTATTAREQEEQAPSVAFTTYLGERENEEKTEAGMAKADTIKTPEFKGKENFFYDGKQTIVLRDENTVIALADKTLDELITANKLEKQIPRKDKWKMWFKALGDKPKGASWNKTTGGYDLSLGKEYKTGK
ncbi:MAG: hypothetical protein FD123_1313 [Bacteroidetes bacterium]|nr:MAG: hypothetical protein FD123_1313 [Bacteroidota bacterium]